MKKPDERLRQLLRDADPAREAAELGAAEVTRLRRAVLNAAEREPREWLPRPAIGLAFAAALAAVVVGLALWRLDFTWTSAPREDRAATTPGSSLVPSTSATAARDEVASVHRKGTKESPHTGPRPSPQTIHSPAAPAETAPTETLAATQPAAEPQERPYQLQLTAPGGTRIVWLLSTSSGR